MRCVNQQSRISNKRVTIDWVPNQVWDDLVRAEDDRTRVDLSTSVEMTESMVGMTETAMGGVLKRVQDDGERTV